MMDFSQLAVTIDTWHTAGTVVIRPHIENPFPLTLQYRMTVMQSSAQGTSSINQQGDVQTGVLANTVTLSLAADASCQVRLQVLEGDVLLKQVEAPCNRTTPL